MKSLEAVVDSDMQAGNYKVLNNVPNRLVLHSIHGNGKVIVSRSKKGSDVECFGDDGGPASGVASTIRNYLTAQNIENVCKGNKLQVNLSPNEMVKFILDFGTFSGFAL